MGAGKMGAQDVCLCGLAGLAGFNFDNLNRAKSKGAASGCGAVDIGFHQIELRGPRQPPHSKNCQLQLKAMCAEASTDQIFSIL